MHNGSAASYHDNSTHGEDVFLIRELGDIVALDAVLDGVTHCEGGYASSFTAQLLGDATIESPGDIIDALEQANNTLFETGRGRTLLTTISAALKVADELHLISAGDSPAYLIRGGEASELTTIVKSSLLPSLVGGAVGLHEKFTYVYKRITLERHDRLLLATDGLLNNVFPHELAEIVGRAASPQEAVTALQELISEKRRLNKGREDAYGTFREDDQTAVIRYLD